MVIFGRDPSHGSRHRGAHHIAEHVDPIGKPTVLGAILKPIADVRGG